MMSTACLDGGRRGVDTAVVGWWCYWWGYEVLLGGPPTAPSVLSIMVDSDADEWDLLGYGVREVDGVTHRPKNYG